MNSKPRIEKDHYYRNDGEILNDVIAVCRDGERFYKHAADQVASQQVRNIFLESAKVRSKIVSELEMEVIIRSKKPNKIGTVIGNIRSWYSEAMNHIADYSDRTFIEQLEETENRTLNVLRDAVRRVNDKTLVFRLSSLVASFQISYDQLKSLKASYK